MKAAAKDLSLNIVVAYIYNNYINAVIEAFFKVEVL